jgi:hypothetical protein
MEIKIKPRVRFIPDQMRWLCDDNCLTIGFGVTPLLAFADWQMRSNRVTSIPRHGHWNIRDCMNWWRNGCKRISVFINGKRIVGYDQSSDSLILRG